MLPLFLFRLRQFVPLHYRLKRLSCPLKCSTC